MNNSVTIIGNLGSDPELRYTPNGAAIVEFSVAVSNPRKNEAGDWEDGEATWVNVKAWRGLAENAAESLAKGARVVVFGKLVVDSWEAEDGGKRSRTSINATDIAPSLLWATASVTRQSKVA